MEKLVSFDMMPNGIERYTVKNLKINPNLEFFERTLKHNFITYTLQFIVSNFYWAKNFYFSSKKILTIMKVDLNLLKSC